MAQALAQERQDENEAAEASARADAAQLANVIRFGEEQWLKQQRLEKRIEQEEKEYLADLELKLAKRCTQCDAGYRGDTRSMKHRRWGRILLPSNQCNTCERGYCDKCYPNMIIQCDWCTSDNTICRCCQPVIVAHKQFKRCQFCHRWKCPIDITVGNDGVTLCCLVCRPSVSQFG